MEVDNPDEPDGPSFFQFTTYVAKEKQTHKKQFSCDKTRAKGDSDNNDFSLDRLDFSLNMKESGKTLRAIANQAKTGATLTSGSSGSGSGHCSGAGLVGTGLGSGSGQALARPWPVEAV